MQKVVIVACVMAAIAGTGSYVILKNGKAGAPGGEYAEQQKGQSPTPLAEATPTPRQYDIDTPSSVTAVINKLRPLPEDYRADDLYAPDVPLRESGSAENMQVRRVMEPDINALFAAAADAGLQLAIGSAYRSASTQSKLYNGYVASSGQAYADLTSARPGFSEHQTGLSIDFIRRDGNCFIEKCFAETAEGKWLATNAHLYGFVLRYPFNKTEITGYDFEPWHYRYIGTPPADEIYEKGLTLEEFFKIGPAPDYTP